VHARDRGVGIEKAGDVANIGMPLGGRYSDIKKKTP
jgi:hypothetical protein